MSNDTIDVKGEEFYKYVCEVWTDFSNRYEELSMEDKEIFKFFADVKTSIEIDKEFPNELKGD